MMILVPKTVGLALFSFARHAAAAECCVELIKEVAAIATSGIVSIETDFSCAAKIKISASQDVTITGPATIYIGAEFHYRGGPSSLFVNDGILTLRDISFESEASKGKRAVCNTGSLSVEGCAFNALHGHGRLATVLNEGGAIYSLSSQTITITNSSFTSNIVSSRGGAIYAGKSETLAITGSTFVGNEAGTSTNDEGTGGDVWADFDVELTVNGTAFSGSRAEYGGASIECCGGTIIGSTFSNSNSLSASEHFGAVLVGRPGVGCPRNLTMTSCTFRDCTVNHATGAGGSLAIFDTSATITDCAFEGSVGTALLFESSSASGEHKISMSAIELNQNFDASDEYALGGVWQGAAVVVSNTGVEEGDEPVAMGEFNDVFCFLHDPSACEIVYYLAHIVQDGDFKCNPCAIESSVGATGGTDNDSIGCALVRYVGTWIQPRRNGGVP